MFYPKFKYLSVEHADGFLLILAEMYKSLTPLLYECYSVLSGLFLVEFFI